MGNNQEKPTEEILEFALKDILASYDPTFGGFGASPKFPQHSAILLLLSLNKRYPQKNIFPIINKTLTFICQGGIYDHLKGGIHRYSTHKQWQVPHFEKMLYDQALFVQCLVEAYAVSKEELFKDKACQTLDYIITDFTDKQGGFYSALDADSYPVKESQYKEEGAFYVWDFKEIKDILDTKELFLFRAFYDIREQGNLDVEAVPLLMGKNILRKTKTLSEVALELGEEEDIISEQINDIEKKLLSFREQKPKPFCDKKILVDWNALMIKSFLVASRVFNNPNYLAMAEQATHFILENMFDKEGILWHSYYEGQQLTQGLLNDYAFFKTSTYSRYSDSFGKCDSFLSAFTVISFNR